MEGSLAVHDVSGVSISGKGTCGHTKVQYAVLQGMAAAFAQDEENLSTHCARKSCKGSGMSAMSLTAARNGFFCNHSKGSLTNWCGTP